MHPGFTYLKSERLVIGLKAFLCKIPWL